MRSFREELKLIEQQNNIKYAQSMLGNATKEQIDDSMSNTHRNKVKISKQQQYQQSQQYSSNLNNTETTCAGGYGNNNNDFNNSMSQQTQQTPTKHDDILWRELSFHKPNQVIRVKEFTPIKKKSNINIKNRTISSYLSSPVLVSQNSKQRKYDQQTNSIHQNNNINNNILNTDRYNQILKLNKKNQSNYYSYGNRIKTEEDRQNIKRENQQIQDAGLYDFLKGHLSDLYTDKKLDPYKQNMNLEKRIYLTETDESNTQQNIVVLEQKLKIKQISEAEKMEEEYQIEKQKNKEENKLYFKKMYKIQKSALNQYLNGEGVEKNVISCHKEIVNPLAAYVEQKSRENYQKNLQEKNRSFIKNNQSPSYETQNKNNNIIKFKPKVNKNNKNNNNNGLKNEIQRAQSVEEIKKNKDKISEVANVNFLDNFLKGERVYFEKLGEIAQIAKNNFIQDIHINQKFYYDQIDKPVDQYLADKDMQIQRNPHIMKKIQQQLLQQQQMQNQHRNSIISNNKKESLVGMLILKQLSKGLKNNQLQQQQSKVMLDDSSILKQQQLQQPQSNNLQVQQQANQQLQQQTSNCSFQFMNSQQNQLNQQNPLSPPQQYFQSPQQTNQLSQLLHQQSLNLSKPSIRLNQQNSILKQNKNPILLEDQEESNNNTNNNKTVQIIDDQKINIKRQNVLKNMIDRYETKQEEIIIQQKDQITQKQNYEQSIDNMSKSKNDLAQNLQNIKQIQILSDVEKEIFQLVKNNKIKEIEAYLLIKPQLINIQDHTGKSLLHWASMRGFVDLVNLLIRYKANLNILDLGNKMPKDLALLHNQQQIYGILQKEERYTKQIQMQKNYHQNLINSSSILLSQDNSPQIISNLNNFNTSTFRA